jgi:hypothetical protein
MTIAKHNQASNLLQQKHDFLIQLPKSFRAKVCEECGWSEATFYRKARGKNTFSKAEKDKIASICDELVKDHLPSSIDRSKGS